MTRVLCNGAGGPQLVNFTRSQLNGSTNFLAMREINISYNMGSVREILTLSGVKQALQPFYRKHLFNQIKDLLRLFPTTTIRICALRKKQKDQKDPLPLEKEQCEMLCFRGKRCVVKVRVLAKGDQTELMEQLKVLEMPELEVVFDPAGNTDEEYIMIADGGTSLEEDMVLR
ncbi:hypothetical protein LTS08_005211 [Lithohypha guttulata]|nr:hypothetical protein LTS08_005211 [Lithohypha guttulata]